MKPLVLSLRQRPDQRLDLSALVPDRLVGKSVADIERIDLSTSRRRVDVGEVFRVRAGGPEQMRLEGACDRLDLIGHGMSSGEMIVEGDVGAKAGRLMNGGRLVIEGHAGPWAASGMQAGHLEITGSAGDRLGGPLAGEVAGMRGGLVLVGGNAGERAGDRMRRGTIVISRRRRSICRQPHACRNPDRAPRRGCAAGLSDAARDYRLWRARGGALADIRGLRYPSFDRDAFARSFHSVIQ